MSFIAIVLVVVSCAIHAGWNLLSKSRTPSAAFFAIATTSSVLLISPLYIYFIPHLSKIPPGVWKLLLLTGGFQAFYFINLGNAYRLNDMSLAYPLARSLPVLMVPLATFLLSFSKPLSALAVAGMIVTAVGCMILPLASFDASILKQYLQRSLLFVALAAVGTSGYSICDSRGLVLLAQMPAPMSSVQAALFIIAFENLVILLFIWPYVLLSRREKVYLRVISKKSLRVVLMAGPMVTVAYTLVLIAMQFADNVSYIVAFRQLSIVIGILLSAFILKEKVTSFKVAGAALIVCGLVVAALG